MRIISEGYLRITGGILTLALILHGVPGKALAEGWETKLGTAKVTGIDGWSDGFPVETAQAEARFDFDIPAEALTVALARFEQITGLKVAADSKTIAATRTVGA